MKEKRTIAGFFLNLARNSPWLFIAVLLHVILGFLLAVVYVKQHFEKEDTGATQLSVVAAGTPAEEPVIMPPEQIDRKAIPKNQEAELVSYEEQTYMPAEELEEQDLHLDVGDPNALDNLPPGATGGTSIGVGTGPGHYASGSPSAFASRRAGGGGKGRRTGPTQGTEKSVLEGLRWLVRHQNEDGSWSAATLHARCSEKQKCVPVDAEYKNYYDEGLTGLALLAFLGAGLGHDAKQTIVDTAMAKKYTIGEVVKNGLKWLKDRQREDGSFSEGRTHMYNQALATLAMCEAYGLTGSRYWKDPAELGVQFLINAQKHSIFDESLSGWRYDSLAETEAAKERGEIDELQLQNFRYDVDVSATCWVTMALKSATLAGIEVPEETMQGALSFAKYVTGQNGLVGYQHPDKAGVPIDGPPDRRYHTGAMTALGMLIRIFVAQDLEDPFHELAARYILTDLPEVTKDHISVDYYYWYHATLALHQFDGPDSPRPGKKGEYWDPWNKAMIDALLELQDKSKAEDVCSRGGWLVADRWSHSSGPIYSTAISTLTLEVYYRYENAFGAGKKVAESKGTTEEASGGTPGEIGPGEESGE
jgi:hypothetical protein